MIHFHGLNGVAWGGELPAQAFFDLPVEISDRFADPRLEVSSSAFAADADFVRRRVVESLFDGPGLLVMRNFPVEAWDDSRAQEIFGALGSAIGAMREQSSRRNRLHLVTDSTVLGVSAAKAGGSNSRKRIALHTENARPPHPPHILSLLCLRAAARGGESLLMDGARLHDVLNRGDAELLAIAYKPFRFGRHAEDRLPTQTVDESPIFWCENGRTMFRYSRYWLDVAEETTITALPPEGERLLDTIDAVLEDPATVARFQLEPGDAIFINNRRVMHGRESFDDFDDPCRRRCLVRMWLDVE